MQAFVTASHISSWANSKEAQSSLPRLIRRLINAAASPEQCDFPAGDSSNAPGWDGEVIYSQTSAWIPTGTSVWELSCEQQPKTKADRDYGKRTKQTDTVIRQQTTLVIVTARKWTGKKRWQESKRQTTEWKDIRVFDADDLEQWLEQCWPVELQFAEELGINGPEIESIAKYWDTWRRQTEPAITSEAFFASREETRTRLIDQLQKQSHPEIYRVRADSTEEATAFICCSLLTDEYWATNSIVVMDAAGWRYAQMHNSIKVAIAATPEIAERPPLRPGLTIIVPYSSGDMAGFFHSKISKSDLNLVVDRPDIYRLEKALQEMGFDENDAHRTTANIGRSWSVYRRQFARNPAIRTPNWLAMPQAKILSVLCLLGCWSSQNSEDKILVSELASYSYENIEKDLLYLALQDDAPVLKIGNIWKAKSPLELLALFGERISNDELNRFFEIAEQILAQPDPILELPDEKRHAAQIYGKQRPQSDFLIEALCDSLIKLAVMAPQLPGLQSARLDERITGLVGRLLRNADAVRWLSLSSQLPALAEAAPDAFLKAVEFSLTQPDIPVTELITETRGSGLFGGRCWHAGLLWALETIAWTPKNLPRSALLLTRLVRVPVAGNWGNTPMSSLLGLFRSWLPQTAAPIEQRIATLDLLIKNEEEVAFRLLDSLVHIGPDSANFAARPAWRDDDVGFGRSATENEYRDMVFAAADRMIILAEGNARRIAELIQKLDAFDEKRIWKTLALIDPFLEDANKDESREIICAALRKRIHWLIDSGNHRDDLAEAELSTIQNIYHQLQPKDLVLRHRWLYDTPWLHDAPWETSEDYNADQLQIKQRRIESLNEIYTSLGVFGIQHLAQSCGTPLLVGVILVNLDIDINGLKTSLFKLETTWLQESWRSEFIRGYLNSLDISLALTVVRDILNSQMTANFPPEQSAALWLLAPHCRAAWNEVSAYGPTVESAYWTTIKPSYWPRDKEDLKFILDRLLIVERSRTAFDICRSSLDRVETDTLTSILERFIAGEEMDGPIPSSWTIKQALEKLQNSRIDRHKLIQLEFALFPALGYGNEQCTKTLYQALVSEPALFTELLCAIFKPRHGERVNDPTDAERSMAETALKVLNNCRLIPGAQTDNLIDSGELAYFIEETRRLCREADRLEVCDSMLGQILAHSPIGLDGIWPCEAVRDLLDHPELDKMRNGFRTGIFNKRGVVTYAPGEGGNQERQLAVYYHQQAQAMICSHINIAETLELMACDYESHGTSRDLDAELSRESF